MSAPQKSPEEVAKEIIDDLMEQSKNFVIDPIDEEKVYNNPELISFLNETKVKGLTEFGIEEEGFINNFKIYDYDSKQGVNTGLLHEIPQQLAYISRLNKIFDYQFMTECDGNVKFNNIDVNICKYIKDHPIDGTYNALYKILKQFLIKLIVSSCCIKESAFKSNNIWVSDSFKIATKKDIIMLQCLEDKLKTSFTAFFDELGQTKDSYIFNDIGKIPKIILEGQDFEIEQILASSIKAFTPMFIYDYFSVVKSAYMMIGLLNVYMEQVIKKERKYDINDIHVIAVVPSFIYQNTRLNQHSTMRQLPYFSKDISNEAQGYYLNHTVLGPQFMLLKCLEKALPALPLRS